MISDLLLGSSDTKFSPATADLGSVRWLKLSIWAIWKDMRSQLLDDPRLLECKARFGRREDR